MSVTIREYQGRKDVWEVDIRVLLPNGETIRERKKAPVSGKSAAQRWAESRERELVKHGKPKPLKKEEVQTPTTLGEFALRFIDGHANANRLKPSGKAAYASTLRNHLIPALGEKPLGTITTEDVQRLKSALHAKSPKTVNNVLTVLNVMLKTAVAWEIIECVPCTIKLLTVPKSTASFYDFEEYDRLVEAARRDSATAYLIVLLGGEAGLRCGEMMALEWSDVNLGKRQLTVARSEWKGHVTTTKSGRVRHLPLTTRLTAALKEARHLKSDRVLCDKDGASLTQKEVQVSMRRVARKAQVKPGVHILRHTFCSHLAMKGAPARAIQDLAGHQDLTTTQRYMHLSPAALDAAISLLDGPRAALGRGEIVEAAGKST
jgi:integrase